MENLKRNQFNIHQRASGDCLNTKTCSVCGRASFLKCKALASCSTVYCSSTCQLKDWEVHQYTHAKSKYYNIGKQPRVSVQHRLKDAINKEPSKCNIAEQLLKRLDEVEESCSSRNNNWVSPTLFSQQLGVDKHTAKKPHASVQNRLKDAVKEPLKCNTAEQLLRKVYKGSTPTIFSERFEIAELTTKMETAQIQEHPYPMAQQSPKLTTTPFIIKRKYKRHCKFMPEHQDAEGFSHALVTEVDDLEDEGNEFWCMPLELKANYDNYINSLSETYDSQPILSISEIEKYKNHLVITKVSDSFYARTTILKLMISESLVSLLDIDTGRKYITSTLQKPIKKALEQDMMKSAYSVRVIFENLEDLSTIHHGDAVIMKVTLPNPFGASVAELKTIEEDRFITNVNKTYFHDNAKDTEACNTLDRYFIDAIKVKELNAGPEIKLMFLDGSKLEMGKLHVCESIKTNWNFYQSLIEEIAEHTKNISTNKKYKPVSHEMLLAKFTDGCYYRAVTIEASNLDSKVHFIDYGSDLVVDLNDVIPMPSNMLYSCCSHTVDVKLRSGRDISELNYDETCGVLQERNVFTCEVQKQFTCSKVNFTVILDDALVIYKK